jgi:hypothetical protein
MRSETKNKSKLIFLTQVGAGQGVQDGLVWKSLEWRIAA